MTTTIIMLLDFCQAAQCSGFLPPAMMCIVHTFWITIITVIVTIVVIIIISINITSIIIIIIITMPRRGVTRFLSSRTKLNLSAAVHDVYCAHVLDLHHHRPG